MQAKNALPSTVSFPEEQQLLKTAETKRKCLKQKVRMQVPPLQQLLMSDPPVVGTSIIRLDCPVISRYPDIKHHPTRMSLFFTACDGCTPIVAEDNEAALTEDEIGNLFQVTSSEDELGNE